MTLEELRHLTNISVSGEGVGWTHTVGDFLDLVARLAQEERFWEISECFNLYIFAHPEAGAFLSSTIPFSIMAYDPALQETDKTPTGLDLDNISWPERLEDSLRNPKLFLEAVHGLRDAIRKRCQNNEEFKPGNYEG
jgi:hypothetical protein